MGEPESVSDDSVRVEDNLSLHLQILHAANQAVITTDLAGIVTFWNRHAERLYGWTQAEAVGRGIMELVVSQPTLAQAEQIMARLSRGEIWSGEFPVHSKDGTQFPVDITNAPIFGSRGELVGIVGFSVDARERRQAERALRESDERFRAIVQHATAGVSEMDLEGNHILVNQKFCEMLGYSEAELLARNLRDITHPEDLPLCLETFEKAITTAMPFVNEKRLLRKDGKVIYVSDSVAGIFDEGGAARSVAAVAVDITVRKQAELVLQEKEDLQKLVAAQEDERRRIALNIHDQLGQQMTALRLKLDSLEKSCPDEELRRQLGETQKIAAQIDHDVDFIAWELRPAALDDLGLRLTIFNYVREWARHTGVRAEFDTHGIGSELLPFEIETNLYRIIQEALNNIAKHAAASTVSVLLEKRRDAVVLIIEDDGVGFNPADQAITGKGIGLIGMRERARLIGGAMEIESTGELTTVFIRIPVAGFTPDSQE